MNVGNSLMLKNGSPSSNVSLFILKLLESLLFTSWDSTLADLNLIGIFLSQNDLIFERMCLITLMRISQSRIKLSIFTNCMESLFIRVLVFTEAITIATWRLNQETGITVTMRRFKKLRIRIEFWSKKHICSFIDSPQTSFLRVIQRRNKWRLQDFYQVHLEMNLMKVRSWWLDFKEKKSKRLKLSKDLYLRTNLSMKIGLWSFRYLYLNLHINNDDETRKLNEKDYKPSKIKKLKSNVSKKFKDFNITLTSHEPEHQFKIRK